MAVVSLKASSRETTGKGAARKIRFSGQIPAVVYRGGEAAVPVTIDPHELERLFARTKNPNTIVEIDVEGGVRRCLVRDVQRHPVSGAIRHVDFYEVQPDQKVAVTVPVELVGRAVGTRMGGKLQIVRRELDIRARPDDIPSAVQVDVSDLNVGQFIRASAIKPPPGVELVYTQDFNVATVLGKQVDRAAPAAAPAEGT